MSDRAVHWYPPGPNGREFMKSDAFVAGIMGPIGSGKSTCCVMKLIRNMQKQKPLRDGWRRRRTAIIRNTYPELKTTTIKTWHQWLPASTGKWRDSGPPTQHIIDEAQKVDWEIMFIALDRPDDVRKLLSLELSDAWINEARSVPKAILDGLTGRVGRFPPRDGEFGCTDPQILMDTNPPDTDHWWYVLAERDTSNERNRQLQSTMDEIEEQLRVTGGLRRDQKLFEFFRQPGGRDAGAENVNNLPPGYYLKAMAGKDEQWVRVYVDGDYGFVLDGKPVYPEYRDSLHCRSEGFNPTARLPILIGMDFGLTPAAVFAQIMPNGQWRKHSELVTDNMGIIRFAQEIKRHIGKHYHGFTIGAITGDPAGNARNDDERTTFDLLRANGIDAKPAGTNSPTLRIEAVRDSMKRLIDGEPGMLINGILCPTLRKGYAGGYNYRRIQVSGEERYQDEPNKNMFSHVCDADQYCVIGGGEGRAIMARPDRAPRAAFAVDDYSILG
jgi:hypothetical protein